MRASRGLNLRLRRLGSIGWSSPIAESSSGWACAAIRQRSGEIVVRRLADCLRGMTPRRTAKPSFEVIIATEWASAREVDHEANPQFGFSLFGLAFLCSCRKSNTNVSDFGRACTDNPSESCQHSDRGGRKGHLP